VHNLDFIRRRLAEHQPETFTPRETTRQAAVAVILREATNRDAGTDILFIKRAEKEGDPWSGHMAFPGGHLEEADADLRAASMRETMEEIGLDLGPAQYLGALDQQRAMPRGRPAKLISNDRHDWETKPMAGQPTVFNGYRLERGHFVWGLTYRMLKSFFETLNPDWNPPSER
jgi:8-oxo-dGTP pyrophosphatase MutT (NUDIX family)